MSTGPEEQNPPNITSESDSAACHGASYRTPLSDGAVQILLWSSGRTLNTGSLIQLTKSSCQWFHS
jgi:hypothetical protein